MRTSSVATLLVLVACSSKEGGAPPGKESASGSVKPGATSPPPASASGASSQAPAASPGATGSAAPPPEGPPVCKRSDEKVWTAGVSRLTGLTTKGLGGKMAIGFAIGTAPRVLVVDKDGSAKLMKVKLGAKAKAPPPKEANRMLMRVSPADVSGDEATAFLDYHDEYKDKRRHVWCGPADADDTFLEFDGKSWLDLDPKPTGDEKKKLFSKKKLGGYFELRDCRTFVSTGNNEVWALGSVLRGTERPDGSNEWKMAFVVDFGKDEDEIVLYEAPLKGDPPKASAFEIPISRRIKDKGWLVAARFQNQLVVGLLDKDKKLRGSFKGFPGFPTMPEISTTDEDNLVLVTGVGAGKQRGLKALTVSRTKPEMPTEYRAINLVAAHASDEASFSAPELVADDKGRRWLAYADGPKDKAQLRIVPVGVDLQPNGRAFDVTGDDAHASEVRVVAIPGGKLVVVYLRDKDGKTELVSEQLSCEVIK